MAFDYTKKANYHYIDLSDIDESLLNHPLYPNRTGKEKNALYFADKAFICEAYLSRSNMFKGLTINDKALGSEIPKLTNALTKWPSSSIQAIRALRSFPDSSITYDSVFDARDAITGIIDGTAQTSTYSLSLEYYAPNHSNIETYYEKIKSRLSPYPFAIYYSPISFDNAEYETIYLSGRTDRDSCGKICYHYIANWSDYYDGEYYTQIKNTIFTKTESAPAGVAMTYGVYGIVSFSGFDVSANKDATYYAILEIDQDGPTFSKKAIERGKTIFPRATTSLGDIIQEFHVACNETYIIAKSSVDISI